ncbi:uncharacterized protein [Taeniopygia guttata]|uniref:uncharacterized protein n=1 Tax=Taeniopygia guttata TaxID=59729 RepID=UPI003BB91BD4
MRGGGRRPPQGIDRRYLLEAEGGGGTGRGEAHRLPRDAVLLSPGRLRPRQARPSPRGRGHCALLYRICWDSKYELESKAAKWYATIDISNAFFSIPLAAECRPQFAFTWRGVQYTWNRLPQGWKHSPTICHGLIQTALEKALRDNGRLTWITTLTPTSETGDAAAPEPDPAPQPTSEVNHPDWVRVLVKEGEARENRIFWTVWIRWPGTSEPQKYDALVDTGAQCTLIPSGRVEVEPVSIAGVTGGLQQLTLVEAEVSLTGKEWKKHPIVTGPDAPCILGIDFLQNSYYKDPKGLRWAFGIAAVEAEYIKQLSTLSGLSENLSAVGLLRVEEQHVPIATSTVHCWQYRTDQDAVIPIHRMIRELESQRVVSKTHSPFKSPIWPVRKSDRE